MPLDVVYLVDLMDHARLVGRLVQVVRAGPEDIVGMAEWWELREE